MKIYFTNIVKYLLTLMELTVSTNGSELINANEGYSDESVKKRIGPSVSKEIPLDGNRAKMTSIEYTNYPASKAITKYCKEVDAFSTRTKKETNPAWSIDLKKFYTVEKIVVKASPHRLYAEDFEDAFGFVSADEPNLSDLDFTEHCASFKGPAKKSEEIVFQCRRSGRFAYFALKGSGKRLVICHVSIYRILFIVDGKWSEWSEWSQCKMSCGEEFQKKTRSCTAPRPQNGGKDCVGRDNESKSCRNELCPGDFKKMSNKGGFLNIIYAILASMGAGLVVALVIAAVMYRRKKMRYSDSSTEQSYLYQESGTD